MTKESWVLCKLHGQGFGLPTGRVLEMMVLPTPDAMVGAPPYVRGVINLRGLVIPVVDLRQRLAMGSLEAEVGELLDSLDQRRQDHIDWLDELKASVLEEREFRLTTDPHKCAFGKWYDNYVTDNAMVRMLLDKFDTPHRAIHATATRVSEMSARGDRDGAQALIDETRFRELATLLRLFGEMKTTIREETRETVIIAALDNVARVGLIVDQVVEVRQIDAENVEDTTCVEAWSEHHLISKVAKLGKDVTLLLDIDAMFSDWLTPIVSPAAEAQPLRQ